MKVNPHIIYLLIITGLLIAFALKDNSKDYSKEIESLKQQKQALQATADSLELLILIQDEIVEEEIKTIPIQRKNIHDKTNAIRILPVDSAMRFFSGWVSAPDSAR